MLDEDMLNNGEVDSDPANDLLGFDESESMDE